MDKLKALDKKLLAAIGAGIVIVVLLIALIAVIAENNSLRKASLNTNDSVNESVEQAPSEATNNQQTDNNNNSQNNEQPSQNPATSTAASSQAEASQSSAPQTPAEDGDYTLTYSAGNTWADGETKMCGLELSVTNNSGSNVEGWNLVIQIENLVV